jgi:hypothetical protein
MVYSPLKLYWWKATSIEKEMRVQGREGERVDAVSAAGNEDGDRKCGCRHEERKRVDGWTCAVRDGHMRGEEDMCVRKAWVCMEMQMDGTTRERPEGREKRIDEGEEKSGCMEKERQVDKKQGRM